VTVTIRTATVDDAEALRGYATKLFAERPPGIFERPAPTVDDEIAFIRSHLEPAGAELFIAEDDGRIVGNLGVTPGGLPQEAHVGTVGVSVDSDYRGHGIATAMFEALFAWAPGAGISRLQLYSFANNPRAAALYRRLGFEDEGLLREAVLVDGEFVDVLLLAKLLGR
jgi:RimJ/RimL family protein N-acetyltransferase